MTEQILVVAEHRRGVLREVTFEMLALADRLARARGAAVAAVVVGAGHLAEELKAWADRVVLVAGPQLEEHDADAWLWALAAVVGSERPLLTLVGHSAAGMDVAPALAVRTGLPLVSDCADISVEGAAPEVVRQPFAGKVDVRLTLKTAPGYVITVRPGCAAAEPGRGRSGEVEELTMPPRVGPSRSRFLRLLDTDTGDVDITAAPILVSVGRGVGTEENLAEVQLFADSIGATVSCSRPVADTGWLPKSCQVGTSGQQVRPRVYLALGISGAYQHVAGIRGAGTVIAVNTDPRAPIFDVAHYGIVGDLMDVLPVLQEKLSRNG